MSSSERKKKKSASTSKKKVSSREGSPKTPSNKSRSSSRRSVKKRTLPEAPEVKNVPAFLPPDLSLGNIVNYNCPIHGKPLLLYCETREEPICEMCVGAVQSFRILPINEAYRIKLAMFYNTLNTHLFSKKEQIIGYIRQIEWRIEEFRRHHMGLERDMKGEFSAMNERLNSAYGTQTAMLEHSVNGLNSDLSRINQVITSVEGAQDPVAFLKESRELKDQIERCVSKPIMTDMPITNDDLPRELANLREVMEEIPAVQQLLNTKDTIIWTLLNSKDEEKLDGNVQKELTNWARLTDQFATQLQDYQLVCAYCGLVMDPDNVNSNCPRNLIGDQSGRHHFIKQVSENDTSLKVDSSAAFQKAKDWAKKIKKRLKKADKEQNGTIANPDFTKMMKKLGFDLMEVDKILACTPQENGAVLIKKFLKRLK